MRTRRRFALRISVFGGVGALGLLFTSIVFAATPVAANLTVQTNQAVAKTITLSGTEDLPALDFTVTSGPTHGTLDRSSGTMTCDGGTPATCVAGVLYTPVAGQWSDSFTYTVTNATDGISQPATVSITVDATPVAIDDPDSSCADGVTGLPKKYIAIEDQTLTITPGTDCGLLLNDTDADVGDTLTASKVTNPGHGAVSVTAAGGFTYTPNANYSGFDSFTYSTSDGLTSATATVSITVLSVDDPPSASNDLSLVVGQSSPGTVLNVLANDTALPDTGETLSIVAHGTASHGSVAITSAGTRITYTPTPFYLGPDSFTYTIQDSGGSLQDTATVSLNVTKDVTPPVVSPPNQQIRTALSMTSASFAIRVAWSGADAGVGISRFEVQAQVDGGTWTSQALATPMTTSINPFVTVGHVYHYRVRGIDRNGNIGPWRYGQNLAVSRYEETNALITYVGTWVKSPLNASNSGGYTKYAFGGGKSATFTVTARDVGFVAPISVTRGSARLYVDGVLVGTFTETRSTTIYRRVIWARHFSALGSHSLRVVLVGDGRIDVDCFLALR